MEMTLRSFKGIRTTVAGGPDVLPCTSAPVNRC